MFGTDLQDQVIDGWSITQWMMIFRADFLKDLCIANRDSSSQCTSLNRFSFETFGYKLSRLVAFDSAACQRSFQAFAHDQSGFGL